MNKEMIEEFGNNLTKAAMNALMKTITDGVVVPYENKYKVPNGFFEQVWKTVDMEKVKKEMANILEKELAEKVMNKMAQEMATDIKQLLSDKERREKIRSYARMCLDDIINNTSEHIS